MNPARVLWRIIKQTGSHTLFIVYVAFLLLCCGVFCLVEPQTFPTYGNAVWCVFQMITTIGFGDVVPQGMALRVLSIVIGLSSLFVVGLITGIVVNYFNETMRIRRNQSFLAFDQKLEKLSQLSPEELATMEAQYKNFKRTQRK